MDFFSRSPSKKKQSLYYKSEKNPGDKLKKNPGLQDLKFFFGLKHKLIFQDLDFQKLKCRLKGRFSDRVVALS